MAGNGKKSTLPQAPKNKVEPDSQVVLNDDMQLKLPVTQQVLEEVLTKQLAPFYAKLGNMELTLSGLSDLPTAIRQMSPSHPPSERQVSKESLGDASPASNQAIAQNMTGPTDCAEVNEVEVHCASDAQENAMAGYPSPKQERRSMADELVEGFMLQSQLCGDGSRRGFSTRSLECMVVFVKWWDGLDEPERKSCLSKAVLSSRFESLCVLVIVLNSMFVAYTANWEMQNLGQGLPTSFMWIENAFLTFYTIELILRLIVHRLYFFVNSDMQWNIFDTVLVTVAIVDFVAGLLVDSSGDSNLVVMRILRLCKLAKIIRAIRAMRFFKDLAVLMESFKSAALTLVWTFVFLLLVVYIFSLVFMQGLAGYLVVQADDWSDPDFTEGVHKYFGTMPVSMLSLYMAMTGGDDWSLYFGLIERAGIVYAGFFIFFVFFSHLAMMNILTGMIVEKAVGAAAPDRDELVLQQRAKSRQDAREFTHLCKMLDRQRTGTITWEQFKEHMQNQAMVEYMASLGLAVHEVELFFKIVAGAIDLPVSIDQFVEGCMQMKGGATGIDMQRQLFETDHMQRTLDRFEKRTFETLRGCVRKIDAVVNRVSTMSTKTNSEPIRL